MTRVKVSVSSYLLELGYICWYSVTPYDSVTLRSLPPTTGPLKSQVSLSFALSFLRTGSVCLLSLLVSNEKRMNLVMEVITICVHDAASHDRCSYCSITLFSAMLAITSIGIGHIVVLVAPEWLDHVLLWVRNRSQ